MHRLLERQLQRHFGKDFQPDVELKSFLDIVDGYYNEVDREQRLLQNALLINTAELNAVNERVRAQNAEIVLQLLEMVGAGQAEIIDALWRLIHDLLTARAGTDGTPHARDGATPPS